MDTGITNGIRGKQSTHHIQQIFFYPKDSIAKDICRKFWDLLSLQGKASAKYITYLTTYRINQVGLVVVATIRIHIIYN